jgi:hypothetical protein
MLPLDSERWSDFETFGGDPADIPACIAQLERTVGTTDEEGDWGEIRDFFYCQNTIKADTAFATIPHVIPLLARMTPKNRLSAIVDVGMTEVGRGQKPVPTALFPQAYSDAIRHCLTMALDLLPSVEDPLQFRYLTGAIASLSGHPKFGQFLFQLESLAGTCPKCGSTVYLDQLSESGYA